MDSEYPLRPHPAHSDFNTRRQHREFESAGRRPVPVSMLLPVDVKWLIPGWLPAGKVSVLFGEPGVGKSMLALEIVARLSTGRPMPQFDPPHSHSMPNTQYPIPNTNSLSPACPEGTGGSPSPPVPCDRPRRSLLLCAEDGAASTVKPRLEAAGAECSSVHIFQDGGHNAFPDHLHEHILDCDPALVVIDPLTAYLDRLDLHSDQHMRRLFTILTAVAGLTGAAILLIHHQNRRSGGAAVLRCAGSTAIAACARSVMAVARDPEDASSRILVHVKANLCPRAPSLRFHLHEDGPHTRIAWDGIAEGASADSLLGARQDLDGALLTAALFLKETLASGPMPSRELEELATAQGIAMATYNRARAQITRASRVGGVGSEGAWITSLRAHPNCPSAPPA